MSNGKELYLFYKKLLRAIKIPVIETEIWSPGFYQSKGSVHRIYIKKSLSVSKKIKVLIHEYVHYLHITRFYENESRAECEIIAESSAFFILRELGLELGMEGLNEPVLTEFIEDPDRIKHLSAKIQQICNEVISKLK